MKSRVRSWRKIKAYAFSPELYDIRIYYSYRRVWKSNRLLKYKALGYKRAWNGNVMAMINFASFPLSFVANGPGLEFHRYRDKGRFASWLRRCALLKYFHVIYIICGIRDSLTRPRSTRRIHNVQTLPLFALLFYKLPRWSYREIPQWADFPVSRCTGTRSYMWYAFWLTTNFMGNVCILCMRFCKRWFLTKELQWWVL